MSFLSFLATNRRLHFATVEINHGDFGRHLVWIRLAELGSQQGDLIRRPHRGDLIFIGNGLVHGGDVFGQRRLTFSSGDSAASDSASFFNAATLAAAFSHFWSLA